MTPQGKNSPEYSTSTPPSIAQTMVPSLHTLRVPDLHAVPDSACIATTPPRARPHVSSNTHPGLQNTLHARATGRCADDAGTFFSYRNPSVLPFIPNAAQMSPCPTTPQPLFLRPSTVGAAIRRSCEQLRGHDTRTRQALGHMQ
jgi:hypothetical protein